MSYTKKTWHDGDTITAAGLNNMETGIKNNDTAVAAATPFVVPVTITMDGDTPVATPSVTFAQVKDAYAAGRPLSAELALPEDVGYLTLQQRITDKKTNQSMFSFSDVADFSGTGETPAPSFYEFVMTAAGAEVRIIPLT